MAAEVLNGGIAFFLNRHCWWLIRLGKDVSEDVSEDVSKDASMLPGIAQSRFMSGESHFCSRVLVSGQSRIPSFKSSPVVMIQIIPMNDARLIL